MTEGRSVTLDGAGRGSIALSPALNGWRVTRLTTSGTSTVAPTLTVRRGSAGGPVVDATRFGNLDTSETTLEVLAGESIVALYEGGTPGASMVFYVEGTYL